LYNYIEVLLERNILPFSNVVFVLEVSCWTITGERQAARIRALYLKAILRQDITFFDMEMSTGQVVERMAGDTFLIQDAIGEKVHCFEKIRNERLTERPLLSC